MLKRLVKSALGLQKPTHLKAGDPAPALDAADAEGRRWTLADLAGRPFILYFYPKDDTPGCTKEACAFRDQQVGGQVLGVSTDHADSHRAFGRKFNLNFPLLADPDGALSRRYGVFDDGVARRVTFVVDGKGRIVKVFDPVKVGGHADEVAAALRGVV